jgi:hypothetical protein
MTFLAQRRGRIGYHCLRSPVRPALLGTIEAVKKPFTVQLPVTPPAIDIHQLQLTLPLV